MNSIRHDNTLPATPFNLFTNLYWAKQRELKMKPKNTFEILKIWKSLRNSEKELFVNKFKELQSKHSELHANYILTTEPFLKKKLNELPTKGRDIIRESNCHNGNDNAYLAETLNDTSQTFADNTIDNNENRESNCENVNEVSFKAETPQPLEQFSDNTSMFNEIIEESNRENGNEVFKEETPQKHFSDNTSINNKVIEESNSENGNEVSFKEETPQEHFPDNTSINTEVIEESNCENGNDVSFKEETPQEQFPDNTSINNEVIEESYSENGIEVSFKNELPQPLGQFADDTTCDIEIKEFNCENEVPFKPETLDDISQPLEDIGSITPMPSETSQTWNSTRTELSRGVDIQNELQEEMVIEETNSCEPNPQVTPMLEPIPPTVKNGRQLFENLSCDANWLQLTRKEKNRYNSAVTKLKNNYIKQYKIYLETLSSRDLFNHYVDKSLSS